MKLAWFHCFSGIAGDMALGSLVDAGADLSAITRMLEQLPVGGWSVDAEPVLRGGIAGTKVHVRVTDTTVARTAEHIQGLVADARLPDRVQQRAHATFAALAEAEGRLHRRPPEQVHFHEVGGIDAIVDVVGSCIALELLEVDEVRASEVTTGIGMVRSAHGQIPNPAPAVVELLRGAPTKGIDVPVELTTPTGAALLSALVKGWGPLPAMRIDAVGYGAGSGELDGRPNLTQVVLGEAAAATPVDGQPVTLLEANVDDITGEVLAHTITALLAAGAHDAWITPVVMKKGRPGYTVSALADPALASQVVQVLTAETGTFGVRGQVLQRWPAARTIERVVVDGHEIRVKVSPGRAKAEHDDAARVAQRVGRPLREVTAAAESAFLSEQPSIEPASEPASESPPDLHLAEVPPDLDGDPA